MKLNAITGKIQQTVVVTLAGAAIFATVQTVSEAGRADRVGSYTTAAATPLDDPWHPSPVAVQASTLDDPWHPSPVTAQASTLDDPWHPSPVAAQGPTLDDPWHPAPSA
ncbi:hypothetical protein OOK39_41510 [Streptomyces sp. NBC_00264]|uniref:hypothetical protein n=1 Tax=unclassified Streptomyces TaxID=2593676 RepID=UPI000FA18A36|nr:MULTISPECIES: hypothetical protein [unclassified Streptomyces]MCX4399768.1 hypothetical protein [Streptomyces sp. NBC_01767]MCX5106442.1 hypothetical protein [Streptomyces sp. NBC_00439]MCX5165735.1 hypothetical protein [Streptomyces sp. NBC_00305]MCX5224132.1 hypothetical protein [Streptomyces sp. NBC_00264]RPK57152.1 hypothetical protein EES42_39425 [Streptomyces sp. ADI95-17]